MELRLADEARELAAQGARPMLAISPFAGSDEWFKTLVAEGIDLVDFCPPPFFEEWPRRRWNHLRARCSSSRTLRSLKPDLVHVAFAWTTTGGSRLWLAAQCGIPSVISVHNSFPPAALTPWHDRLAAQAFKSVRGIYGVSDSALHRFEAIYGRYFPSGVTLRTLHNFVDTDLFVPSQQMREETRAQLQVPADAPLIGSVGRIDKQKDPLGVARVFARVLRELPKAHLVYVGRGPLEGELKREVSRLGIACQVHFAGFRTDVHRYYPALDVHLLLSKQEGFGISSVEAMSCGIPVVASDVPGTRDILQGREAGVLVPHGDEEAAASAVVRLLTQSAESAARAAAGRHSAITEFSKVRWRAAIQAFYGEIVGPVSAAPGR